MTSSPPELWESLVRADDSATFFQTPAWHALAQDFEGTRTRVLRFDLGDGLHAVLPLQARRRWWGELLAAPFGTYSAVLRGPGVTPAHDAALAARLLRFNLNLPGSPFSPLPTFPAGAAPSGADRPPAHTHVVRLTDLDAAQGNEQWVARWSRNHRRLLKTAQEAGFTVRAAAGPADLDAYCALYRAQARRWGGKARRVYPDELFQEAFRRFSGDGALKLWLAEGPDGIAAGRLCLHHGFHAVEWHAAAESAAMHKGVNHLLVHAAVTRAHAAGHRVYDFNPNPGLDAVDHFKRGFASEVLPFEGLRNRTGFVGLMAGLRTNLATRLTGTARA